MDGKSKRQASAGTTLVETLTVLVIAGVLLGVAVPGYRDAIRAQQLRVAVGDLMAAIDLTRSQAIARGSPLMLAPLDPAGADWAAGWTVFADQNGNRHADPGEPLIYRHGPLADGIAVSAVFSTAAVPAYLSYNSAGRGCGADNSRTARWGTLSLVQGTARRNIKINMLGRVRVCDPAVDAACASAAD